MQPSQEEFARKLADLDDDYNERIHRLSEAIGRLKENHTLTNTLTLGYSPFSFGKAIGLRGPFAGK